MKNIKRFGATALLLAGSVASAEGVKVGGYVNAGWGWSKVGDADATSGFKVSDGAVFLSASGDMAEVFVDLPFMNSGTSNGFSFASNGTSASHAQAYVGHKMENGLSWKLGQFDSFYGYQKNDSVDWRFAADSIIRQALPTTHTGLLLGYSVSDAMGFKVLFANAADQGTRTAAFPKYDMGLGMNMKMDAMTLDVGFLMSGPSDGNSNMLVDVVLGTKVSNMNLSADVVYGKMTDIDADMGFGVEAGMDVSETMAAGARVEWLKDNTGADDATTKLAFVVGPQFKLTNALTVRADFSMVKSTATVAGTDGDAVNTTAINVAGVYKF